MLSNQECISYLPACHETNMPGFHLLVDFYKAFDSVTHEALGEATKAWGLEGMLGKLAAEFSIIKDVFNKSSNALGYDLWDLVQNDTNNHMIFS